MDNSSAPGRGDVVQHLLSRPHNSWLWDAGGVDLDTGQVRAFVAASESGSFGRAAAQLFMSQQALSKRIARLEASLGTLFTRSPGGVTLTACGARFLPDARDMVAMADAAVAGARGNRNGPLRVDVWGHLHPTDALVQGFAAEHPELVVEVSMRRNLPQSLTAVQRREIDVATGNVAGLPQHLPADLACELVTATPLAALVGERHALAGRSHLDAAVLRRHGLWWPSEPGSAELGVRRRVRDLHRCTAARRRAQHRAEHLDRHSRSGSGAGDDRQHRLAAARTLRDPAGALTADAVLPLVSHLASNGCPSVCSSTSAQPARRRADTRPARRRRLASRRGRPRRRPFRVATTGTA